MTLLRVDRVDYNYILRIYIYICIMKTLHVCNWCVCVCVCREIKRVCVFLKHQIKIYEKRKGKGETI